MTRFLVLIVVLAGFAAGPASAHPHVWVTTRAEIVFGPDGRLVAIRHHWTFDESYSAFSVQGLDANADGAFSPAELAGLATENVEALADSGWFTFLKAAGVKQAFAAAREPTMTYAGGQTTLHYLLPLKQPLVIGRSMRLDVYDPTFFVDFAIAPGTDAVRLVGAPKGCTLDIRRPKAPAPTGTPQQLSEAFFQAMSAAADYGARFASGVLVTCP